MNIKSLLKTAAAATVAAMAMTAAPVLAQGDESAVADFYDGQTIEVLVGYSPGGTYDISARLIAQHLGAFIPGHPQVIVQNMPGGTFTIAQQFASGEGKHDGLQLALMNRAIGQLAIQKHPNAQFDPNVFNWIGSLSSYAADAYLLLVRQEAEAQDVDDLQDPDITTVLGAGNAGSTNQIFATLARDVLDLNVDVVPGYPGAAPIFLAMEQGEVDGQVIGFASARSGQPKLWNSGAFRPLVQFGRTDRLDALPDVPVASELTDDPDELAMLDFANLPFGMALPLAAPAGTPEDRVAALRQAFDEMVADPAFQEQMDKIGLDRSPVKAQGIIELLEKAKSTPQEVIEQYNAIVGISNG